MGGGLAFTTALRDSVNRFQILANAVSSMLDAEHADSALQLQDISSARVDLIKRREIAHLAAVLYVNRGRWTMG